MLAPCRRAGEGATTLAMTPPKKSPGVPTISDVAALAGVSRAVASRALSSESRPVSPEKRARVEAAAARLGYSPNVVARGLSRNTFDLVAVVVNHIHDLSDLDLFDRLLSGIQALGKQMILIRMASAEHAVDLVRHGMAYHVDAALVFSDFADAPTIRGLFRTDLVVMLNGRHDGLSPAVVADEAPGIRAAVADAAKKGVKSAALVTGRSSSPNEQQRIALYQAALREAGIKLQRVVQGDYSYASGRAAAATLAAETWPEAVFCTADAMAMGLLDMRRPDFPDHHPGRFRLYGFDNLSLVGLGAYPIATIGFDKAEYVARIIDILRDGLADPAQPLTIPTHFIPGTTA